MRIIALQQFIYILMRVRHTVLVNKGRLYLGTRYHMEEQGEQGQGDGIEGGTGLSI